RPELHLPALGHDQNIVDAGDRTRPVRDHDRNRAPRAQPKNCAGQRFVAFGIEIRIWFVEHDQERVAIERAGKSDTLRLPGRKRAAMIADHRVITLGQVDDELVNTGRLSCGYNRIGIGRILKATNVLRHCSVEQLDILRNVADMAAKGLRRPLIKRGAGEPYRAPQRTPNADQHPRGGRCSRPHHQPARGLCHGDRRSWQRASAGQAQRIALARALYRDPFLIMLDEPNSNLDAEADEALTRAILGLRARGAITVVIAHRPSAIAGVDYILVMAKGRQVQFGPKEEILSRPSPASAAPRSLKIAEQAGSG